MARRWMLWLLPPGLVTAGIVLFVAGVAYDLAFAGIPYPDPTPDQAAAYARGRRVANGIEFAGLLTSLVGLVGLCGAVGVAVARRWLDGRSRDAAD